MSEAVFISSRDNPLLKELRRVAHDSTAYRKAGRFWIEGDHLCSAALQRGQRPAVAVFSEEYWPIALVEYTRSAIKCIVIPKKLFAELSGLESPAGVGFVLELPTDTVLRAGVATVILDRVQDAGNVGSVLRSAGAFGFRQVVALSGTAALWSPKVLRAGMGAHFGLHEGQGVGSSLMALAAVHVRIGQPGGEESLNVAAAAAICLHASSLIPH